MTPGRRGPAGVVAALLGLVVVAVGGAAVADATLDPPVEAPAQPIAQGAAPAGAWYCGATGDEDDEASLSVAAVGEEASAVTVVSYTGGAPSPGVPFELAPGDQRDLDVDARHPVAVRWDGGPAAASWQLRSGGEAAGGPCTAGSSPTWYLTGFDTSLGATSTLHLFNPFSVDAVVRVMLGTPDGPVSVQRADNVVVPAGQVTRLDLNELQPEESGLGAAVEVLSGRVSAVGEVEFEPPERPDGEEGEGSRGRALLPAAPEPSIEAGFGLTRVNETADSWAVLFNPSDRSAELEIRASDPVADSDVLGQVTVPAGATLRLDLAEASEQVESGLSMTSVNGVGIVAAKLTAFDAGERAGVVATLGAEPAAETALVAARAGERAARVGVYNPGGEAVAVDVDAGPGTPPEWRRAELGPNERLLLDLRDAEADRTAAAVLTSTSGPVLVELRSTSPADAMEPWGTAGLTPQTWTGPPTRPAVQRDPALATSGTRDVEGR